VLEGFGLFAGTLYVATDWGFVIVPSVAALLVNRRRSRTKERNAGTQAYSAVPPLLANKSSNWKGRLQTVVVRIAIVAGWGCLALSVIFFFLYDLLVPDRGMARIWCLTWDDWLTGVAGIFAVVGFCTDRKWKGAVLFVCASVLGYYLWQFGMDREARRTNELLAQSYARSIVTVTNGKLHHGMSEAEVEAVLGQGQKVDSGQTGTFRLEYSDMTLMFVDSQLVNTIPRVKSK
jgi:hypothetical protein